MSKYTPWFEAGQQNPERIGVYQVKILDHPRLVYKHWDGRHWGWFTSKPRLSELEQPHNFDPSQVKFKWRGLTTSPKAKK